MSAAPTVSQPRATPRFAWLAGLVTLLGWLALAGPAHAHKESDAHLSLMQTDATTLGVRFDVALRDLDGLLDLDADRDGKLSWGEVRARHAAIERLVQGGLDLSTTAGNCTPGPVDHALDRHSDGTYAVLQFEAHCPGSVSALHLTYRLFADVDASHRLIVRTPGSVRALSPDAQPVAIGWAGAGRGGPAGAAAHTNLPEFVAAGIKHILIGWDHLAFLLLLIAPLVMRRDDDPARTARPVRACLRDTLVVVTAFTIAHSITLGLAVSQLVSLPPRLVESCIAASIVIAAIMNLFRVGRRGLAATAFGFGLVHGFGFASALSDAGLQGASMLVTLLGFNLGVEIGQLMFIAVVWPLAWQIRKRAALRDIAVAALSLLLAAIGSVWLIERAIDRPILEATVGVGAAAWSIPAGR